MTNEARKRQRESLDTVVRTHNTVSTVPHAKNPFVKSSSSPISRAAPQPGSKERGK